MRCKMASLVSKTLVCVFLVVPDYCVADDMTMMQYGFNDNSSCGDFANYEASHNHVSEETNNKNVTLFLKMIKQSAPPTFNDSDFTPAYFNKLMGEIFKICRADKNTKFYDAISKSMKNLSSAMPS